MMHQLKVAIGQIRPRKGDYEENVRKLGGVLAQVAQSDAPPDLVVFPETVVSGYFVQGGVGEVAVSAGTLFRDLVEQHEHSGAGTVDVTVGFYERFENRLFNSAMYATLGGPSSGILHVHRKVFLPTYGLFDEKRFVEEGNEMRAFDAPWGRCALAVCEDVWHSIIPALATLDGAQVILVPGAAPARGVAPDTNSAGERPSTVAGWEARLRHVAVEHGVYVVLAQLVGFEGGKGFQGCSTIMGPDGRVVARAPAFDEAVVTASLSPPAIARARAAQPLLGDLEGKIENLLGARSRPAALRYDAPDDRSPPGPPIATHVSVVEEGGPEDPLALDAELTHKWLVAFLRDEVTVRRPYHRVLVGLSGGVDSATTAALATSAFGKDNVIGIRMPYRTSSDESMAHAEAVAGTLGIDLRTVDISAAVDGYVSAVGDDLDHRRRGNVMARVRMITLFDLSAKLDALPLGTGNKTERLLGYFTWHADDSPPVNPLGDLYKSQVRQLARHLGVPEIIIDKPPTADLVPGQTDEGDLGVSYEHADRILHAILQGYHDGAIVDLGLPREEVILVRRRLDATHWKRNLPTVALVSDTAIGEGYLRPVDY
jgi:NAD+ synthetase